MAAIDEDRLGNEEVETSDNDEESSSFEEDDFADEDAEVSLAEFEEGVDEGDSIDGDAGDIDEVVEMSSKEQSARTLEIRRAIEERMEQRQLHEDLDYLDLDEDD